MAALPSGLTRRRVLPADRRGSADRVERQVRRSVYKSTLTSCRLVPWPAGGPEGGLWAVDPPWSPRIFADAKPFSVAYLTASGMQISAVVFCKSGTNLRVAPGP